MNHADAAVGIGVWPCLRTRFISDLRNIMIQIVALGVIPPRGL